MRPHVHVFCCFVGLHGPKPMWTPKRGVHEMVFLLSFRNILVLSWFAAFQAPAIEEHQKMLVWSPGLRIFGATAEQCRIAELVVDLLLRRACRCRSPF